jgi:hypothetical protein
MPALRILGGRQRIAWLADDDLRCVAKYALLLRCIQIGIAVPSLILLLIVQNNFSYIRQNISSGSSGSSICLTPATRNEKAIIVWSFWSMSMTTIIASIILESLMYVGLYIYIFTGVKSVCRSSNFASKPVLT